MKELTQKGNKSLKSLFLKVLSAYPDATKTQPSKIANIINNELPIAIINALKNNPIINKWNNEYHNFCYGSVGSGNWAAVPWVAILNPTITKSVSEGVYIVYLFQADGKGVYLTLAQGTGGIERAQAGEAIDNMRQELLAINRSDYFKKGPLHTDSLAGHGNNRTRAYEKSCILYKLYSKENFNELTDNEIVSDLNKIIEIYSNFEEKIVSLSPDRPSEFIQIMRRYKDEGTVFQSPSQGARYFISNVDKSGCTAQRIDAKEPVRVTEKLFQNKLEKVRNNDGKYRFNDLDSTVATRTTVLQGLHFGLSHDKNTILDLSDDDKTCDVFCEIIKNLRVDTVDGKPRLYKPTMMACIVEALESGELMENKIPFDWIASRFIEKMKSLGVEATEHNAAMPFFHLTGDLFWMLCYHDTDNIIDSGSTRPGTIRSRVRHAIIKETFWRILQKQTYRKKVLAAIAEKWWPDSHQFWWVNQGKAYKPQREGGFIWAPLLNSQGRPLQHWESMSQVQPDDIVINYSKTKIVAMSVARCKSYAFENELSEELWNKAGRKIDLDYYDLTQPIRLEELQPLIPSINATIKSNKPFTKVNDVNLGYLFNFNLESLKQIINKFRDRIPSEILKLVGEEAKNYWIFQGNPEIYDINRVMTLGITTSWLVTRYKNDIKEGDQGYLWKSGDNAGVVASFEIVKEPSEEIEETDQEGWITEDKKGGQIRCLIKITNIYPDLPVTRSELLNADFGKNISVIKNAAGTNFKISKEEYEKIMQLIEGVVPMDFNTFLNQKGYYFSPNQIKRFILSLKTKPFVILTGNSGTGKTRIAQLFSEYLAPSKKITKTIVPDNDESGTYYKVGKATLKYGLTLPVDSLDYFNIPKIGEPTEILIEFDGESEKEYFATFGYPDNKEKFANSTIRFRKKLKHYVNQNFSIGDYFRLVKLQDREFKLEKVNLEAEISSGKLTNYVLVPVGANWTDKRHIIGFYNVIAQHYQSSPCLDLILEASIKENKQYPFFLILDEMNLSHVERYFSDFLSAMESGESIHLHESQDIEDEDEIPQDIFLPSNLYVIGTVNVDETTYMFSPKVLDRANVIEFPTISALKYLSGDLQTAVDIKDPSFPGNFSIREMTPAEIFKEMEEVTIEDIRTPFFRSKISHEIGTFQNALKKIGFDFGFRVINEIMKYMYLAWQADGKPKKWDGWSEAFDVQILQKMIPKIHGSAKEMQNILKCLYCYCFSGKSDPQLVKLGRGEVVSELYNKDDKEARYKMSARKLRIMQKNLETQRYVSFT